MSLFDSRWIEPNYNIGIIFGYVDGKKIAEEYFYYNISGSFIKALIRMPDECDEYKTYYLGHGRIKEFGRR